jgi:hypothetical protein
MAEIYLHDHKDFPDLLRIIEEEKGILAALVEKDYWIMHSLYGLGKQGYLFQLKGGTSLSKGFNIIDRFSEDIDIHINPPEALEINENPKNSNQKNIEKKKAYYDTLAKETKIDGIVNIARDTAFDDTKKYNSGGIRLFYKNYAEPVEGIKEGILLEAGYDSVTPNIPITISSWAYEKAKEILTLPLIDNRAVGVPCYDYRYSFVEKLQTIASKYRKEMTKGVVVTNYMRQYYDVFSLLAYENVVQFIGTDEYLKHKKLRFSKEDFEIPINENEAFLLNDPEIKADFQKRYEASKGLYFRGQPLFEDVIERIRQHIDRL